MCNYQPLYQHRETGYVIRCAECNIIQVAFKNIALTFYPVDYEGFSECMQTIFKAITGESENSLRAISIPLPCDGIKLLLNKSELNQLIQMLNAADTEMRSQELISLFKNQ